MPEGSKLLWPDLKERIKDTAKTVDRALEERGERRRRAEAPKRAQPKRKSAAHERPAAKAARPARKHRGAKSKPARTAAKRSAAKRSAPGRAGAKRASRKTAPAPYARGRRNEALAADVDKALKAAGRIRRQIEAKIEHGLEELKKKGPKGK